VQRPTPAMFFVTRDLWPLTPKIKNFLDSSSNISLSRLAILRLFWDLVRKTDRQTGRQADRQTDGGNNPNPATVVGVGNYYLIWAWKNAENRHAFGEVSGKSLMHFWPTMVNSRLPRSIVRQLVKAGNNEYTTERTPKKNTWQQATWNK